MKFKPIVLLILDGWGLSPSWGGNALTMNNPKNIDNLWRNYPHSVLQALSLITADEIVGDSRLGHTLIGTGRSVQSNYAIITDKIKNRTFFNNVTLLGAINWAKKNNSNLHLMGLVSDGGVHSHVNHLLALLKMAHEQNFDRVYIDMITDGVDSESMNALTYLEIIENKIKEYRIGIVSSIGGRNYAMDKNNHWDKINEYYKNITGTSPVIYNDVREAITQNYKNNLTDELIKPGLIKDKKGQINPIKNNDAVIFFNFREDRARQLTEIFVSQKFKKMFFKPSHIEDLYFATFINYQRELPTKIVFPSIDYVNSLSEIISKANYKQLKIAESQKSAHVTYFFNGGTEEAYIGEERKIIPSLNVLSFDTVPQMSAQAITDALKNAIKSQKYELIVVNFANVDMVAHTGNIIATGQAVQIVDKLVGDIVQTNLKSGGATIITADHGNAEQMIQLNCSVNSEKETTHSLNPVPFILVTPKNKKSSLQSTINYETNSLSKIIQAKDTLADVAPTILELMQIPKPKEMTGHSLLNRLD